MNMTMPEPCTDPLVEHVLAVIRENVEDDLVVEADSDLRSALGMDSLAVIMIVDGIEERFKIRVQEADIEAMTSVSLIVRLLREKYGVHGV